MKIISIFDSFCWLLFLLLLVVIPLPFGSYDPLYWSFFGTLASVLLCVVLLVKLVDKKADYSVLYAARYVLTLVLLQILYILWQVTASGDFFEPSLVDLGLSPPSWFVQQSSLSADSYAGVTWLAKAVFALIIFLLALLMINSRKRIRWIVYVVIASAVFHALIGLLAKFSSVHLVSEQSLDGHYEVARGLFVNRNHYAAMVNYGLAMLSIGGFYAIYSRNTVGSGIRKQVLRLLDLILSRKLVWLCMVLMLVVCVTLSTSRAAMIGLVGSLFVMITFAIIFDKNFRFSIKWAFLIAVSILGIVFINGADGFLSRVDEGFLSVGERREQWRMTWQIIQQYWLFGTGAGTYSDVFQYYREFGVLRQKVFNQSHSVFLQTLMEQGVVGFSIWIASIIAMFWNLFLGFRRNSSRYMRAVILGVTIALMMALLQSLVDFNLLMPALNVYFYCLLAIGVAAGAIYSSNKSSGLKLDNET